MYREGFEKSEDDGTYICLERSTRRRRRTSVLLLSYWLLTPGSVVDPTPFSLGVVQWENNDKGKDTTYQMT